MEKIEGILQQMLENYQEVNFPENGKIIQICGLNQSLFGLSRSGVLYLLIREKGNWIWENACDGESII